MPAHYELRKEFFFYIKMKDEIKPLASNPQRQATDIIGGYDYQIWQSLYTWIHLADNEILVVEGAEDVDRLSTSEATTTQIKRITSKRITLNTPEVVDAICNFWNLRQAEKTRNVTFYFLTTAERGQEEKNPFSGIKGLDYWEKCKNREIVAPLKKFLQNHEALSKELKEYLKTCSDEDFLNKLVKPIFWLTEQPDLEGVKKQVRDALILHGDKNSFRPDESKSTAEPLAVLLWAIAGKKETKERILGRADFLTEFEQLLTERVSKSELRAMRQARTQREDTLDALLSQQASSSSNNTISLSILKPYIVDKAIFISRQVSINEIQKKMQYIGLLLIKGSSGMGKSVLSLQVVELDRDAWDRINFRGLKPNSIKDVLKGLSDYYSKEPKNIILDDINFEGDYSIYSDSFEEFTHLIITNKKKIIVTTQKSIPQQLALKINISSQNYFNVPKFNDEEITALLLLNSCPREDVSIWLKDIEFTTKSHPQLVHARIRRLKEEGWDKSKILFKTEELAQVKQEVVSNLLTEIPSPEARNLLLRLSILSGTFKKKNALVLAKYSPEIMTPGLILSQLIGPYIENDTEDSFRLSPLLDNAFQNNFPPEEVKVLHQLAGESYLSKTLSPSDLSNIFLHGILSASGKIMFYALAAFQSIDNQHKKLIYPYLEWIMFTHIGIGKPAFESDEMLNLMFRYTQFTLAVETKNDKQAIHITDAWFHEAKQFKNDGPFKEHVQAKLTPFMFFLGVFRYTNLDIPIEKCIEWIIAAHKFIKENQEVNSTFKKSSLWDVSSWHELIPEIALTKRVGASNIEQFMTSIASLQGGEELFLEINTNDILPKRIVDNVWLDQIDKEKPDWSWTLSTLTKLKEFSIARKAFNVAAMAIRAIAIIKNEYTQDNDGAKTELADGIKRIGKHPEVINYEAKMAFIDRDYKLALKIWEEVLPELAKQGDLSTSFAYRDAAVSAANLDDWGKAAKYFKLASEYTKKQQENMFAVQCLADYGFALWKLEKYEECIEIFASVIDGFAKLPNPKNNLRALGLLKMTSNTLIYFKKTLNPHYRTIGIPYTEPFAGSHSQTDFSEKLKELPVPPSTSLWVFLAEVENELNIGDLAFSKLQTIYSTLPILFQTEAKKVEIERQLKAGNISNLVEIMVIFFALSNVSFKDENRDKTIKELTPQEIEDALKIHSSTILSLLAGSILSVITKKPLEEISFKQWDEQMKKYGLEKDDEWKSFMHFLSNVTTKEAQNIMKDGNADASLRLLTSVYTLKNNEDRDSSLYASVLLTSSIKDFSIFSADLDKYLVELLVKRWTGIASILHNMYHDDESKLVLDACADTEILGIKKAAKIVLAANSISFLKIGNMTEKLNSIINS